LIAAMNKLATEPELRVKLGRNGRDRVENFFSRELVLSEMLKYYQALNILE